MDQSLQCFLKGLSFEGKIFDLVEVEDGSHLGLFQHLNKFAKDKRFDFSKIVISKSHPFIGFFVKFQIEGEKFLIHERKFERIYHEGLFMNKGIEVKEKMEEEEGVGEDPFSDPFFNNKDEKKISDVREASSLFFAKRKFDDDDGASLMSNTDDGYALVKSQPAVRLIPPPFQGGSDLTSLNRENQSFTVSIFNKKIKEKANELSELRSKTIQWTKDLSVQKMLLYFDTVELGFVNFQKLKEEKQSLWSILCQLTVTMLEYQLLFLEGSHEVEIRNLPKLGKFLRDSFTSGLDSDEAIKVLAPFGPTTRFLFGIVGKVHQLDFLTTLLFTITTKAKGERYQDFNLVNNSKKNSLLTSGPLNFVPIDEKKLTANHTLKVNTCLALFLVQNV